MGPGGKLTPHHLQGTFISQTPDSKSCFPALLQFDGSPLSPTQFWPVGQPGRDLAENVMQQARQAGAPEVQLGTSSATCYAWFLFRALVHDGHLLHRLVLAIGRPRCRVCGHSGWLGRPGRPGRFGTARTVTTARTIRVSLSGQLGWSRGVDGRV